MSYSKAVYDFTAHPHFHTRDSQPIHMTFDVIIGSYGSSPPKEKGVRKALLFPLVKILGRRTASKEMRRAFFLNSRFARVRDSLLNDFKREQSTVNILQS